MLTTNVQVCFGAADWIQESASTIAKDRALGKLVTLMTRVRSNARKVQTVALAPASTTHKLVLNQKRPKESNVSLTT